MNTNKPLIISSFITTCLIEAAIFVTSKTYLQLGIAVVLYIPLIYYALKFFPRKSSLVDTNLKTLPVIEPIPPLVSKSHSYKEDSGEVVKIADIDKRAFLKLIGATGLTVFITSLISRKIGGSFLRSTADNGITSIQSTEGKVITPAIHQSTDDYKISEVAYGIISYYGFINGTNGWYIMREDTNAGTFRYIKGDNSFFNNWINRERLNYDHYNRVFPTEKN